MRCEPLAPSPAGRMDRQVDKSGIAGGKRATVGRTRSRRSHLGASVVVLALVACGWATGPEMDASIWISVTGAVVGVYDTLQMGFTVEADGDEYRWPTNEGLAWPPPRSWTADHPITWTTASEVVASVNEEGLLVGRQTGVTVVSVWAGDAHDSASIAVRAAPWEGSPQYVVVKTGDSHSCALTEDGSAQCWGDSWYGQLGIGTSRKYTRTLSPVSVRTPGPLEYLSVGAMHACVLADGQAYCWGNNEYGQLGSGESGPGRVSASPTAVSGAHQFSMIEAGNFHTCALTPDGAAYCWGGNVSSRPERKANGLVFNSIAAGGSHTCGVTAGGDAYCWGDNGFGQLGDGTNTSSNVPVQVVDVHAFKAVDAGDLHTCGLTTDGRALCWGNNWNGQLGNGSLESANRPIAVTGGLDFVDLSVGGEHTCGVGRDNRAYCWGSNWRGQLGIATDFTDPDLDAVDLIVPVPTLVEGGVQFATVAAGSERHTCGLSVDGIVYCWGVDGGQLGDGQITKIPGTDLPVNPTPVRVAAPVVR